MSIATLLDPTDAARADVARTIVAALATDPEDPPRTTRPTPASTATTAPTPASGSHCRRRGDGGCGGSKVTAPAGCQTGGAADVGAGGTDDVSSSMSGLS